MNIEKKFIRENNLMYPLHKDDLDNPQRESFIRQLVNSEDFVKTYMGNYERLAEPTKEIIKKFGVKEYLCVLFCVTVLGGAGYLATKRQNTDKIQPQKTVKQTVQNIGFITAGVLAGLLMGFGTMVSLKHTNKEMDIDRFYYRLTIRLFDSMKKYHSDLDEELLKHCNPELLRVVTALLMANMPEKQTLKLQNLAQKISEHKYTESYRGNMSELHMRDAAIKEAMTIIESYLIDNPDVNNVILNVFKGTVPAKFVIQNQKTK